MNQLTGRAALAAMTAKKKYYAQKRNMKAVANIGGMVQTRIIQMTTNLESLSDKELDRLAAEMMCWEFHDKPAIHRLNKPLKDQLRPIWITRDDRGFITEIMECKEWNPTHKDSNQCERWLFPKLTSVLKTRKVSFRVETNLGPRGYFIEIHIKFSNNYKLVAREDCQDPDQINRTKTICWLKSMKAMEEIG